MSLFVEQSHAPDEKLSTLDQLIAETRTYRSRGEFKELLAFINRFPTQAPYNCFLLHMQNPGVQYVANARQWRERFNRRIVDGARPLVVLMPFGPVDFVYDITDTTGAPVPAAVIDPFGAQGAVPQSVWRTTIQNCARDFVKVVEIQMHTSHAGSIGAPEPDDLVRRSVGRDKNGQKIWEDVSAQYRLRINSSHQLAARYATLAHELAHLYCGHLGTPDQRWWPDRRYLSPSAREFEAESVTHLVCTRLNIDNPSARYLSNYLENNETVPEISIECVLTVAGLIERMGREHLPPRKPR